MSKKKHTQQAKKAVYRPTDARTGNKDWEEMALHTFRQKQKYYEVYRREKSVIYEALDMENHLVKRRTKAAVASLQSIVGRYSDVCPRIPQVFSVEEDWLEVNTYPNACFDHEEQNTFTLLGAAIWVLDQIRAADRISEMAQFLPAGAELDEIPMPPLYDLCHSEDLIRGTLGLLQNRNDDCAGAKWQHKERMPTIRRVFMDRFTAENTQHQDVPSRNAFEAVIAMVPQEVIAKAVEAYTKKHWEFIDRYFRTRAVFLEEEAAIYQEDVRCKERAEEIVKQLGPRVPAASISAEGNSILKTGKLPFVFSTQANEEALKLQQELRWLKARESSNEEKWEAFHRKLTSFWCAVGEFKVKPKSLLEEQYGQAVVKIWEDFELEDPYQMAFAFLYLLDIGSDLPWLYFPGMSLYYFTTEALPWPRIRHVPYPDGIWHHRDPETGTVETGPEPVCIPKRVKVPEMDNWYHFQYEDQGIEGMDDSRKCNLGHIMYEITGCIMPRDMNRYIPAVMTLDRYGISGKKAIQPLLYCMTLLGEAKHQSHAVNIPSWEDEGELVDLSDWRPDEIEPESEAELRIAELRVEVKRLKRASYEASKEMQAEKKRYEQLQQDMAIVSQELADLRELVFHQQENTYLEEKLDQAISFPYHTSSRIVVFGGHDSWSREIRRKLPNVRFVDRAMTPNVDMIRKSDVVWIQTNSISHSNYYMIIDAVRKNNVRLRYFSYASATKCAEQIVQEDQKSI